MNNLIMLKLYQTHGIVKLNPKYIMIIDYSTNPTPIYFSQTKNNNIGEKQ